MVLREIWDKFPGSPFEISKFQKVNEQGGHSKFNVKFQYIQVHFPVHFSVFKYFIYDRILVHKPKFK